MTIEAMKQALKALEADEQDMVADKDGHMVFRVDAAITALRQAIEQAEKQEPVALKPCWYESKEMKMCRKCGQVHAEAIIDIVPPPRQPLTDEQRDAIARQAADNDWHDYEVIDAVEAAHGIKGEA